MSESSSVLQKKRADERFVVCNAMVRDDKGPVRYGDVVGLRSRLARGRCLGVRDAAFAGEDEAPAHAQLGPPATLAVLAGGVADAVLEIYQYGSRSVIKMAARL